MSLWVVDYSLNAQLVCLTRKSQVYAHTGWSCVDQTRVDLWAIQNMSSNLVTLRYVFLNFCYYLRGVKFLRQNHVSFIFLVFEVLHKLQESVFNREKPSVKHGYNVPRFNGEIFYLHLCTDTII